MEKILNFIISWMFNVHKLTNIYTSVFIQVLKRFDEEALNNG
jgi:hypothetical protein